ncbi:hypothetical protein [Xanthobacter cornucopiae]|uniref:hypothetical protein n=1 Tax=Xanthobacter cornucopiae TaxID=3119924 RepID=UPI00372CF25F
MDALGDPVTISLTPGQQSALSQAEPLLDQVEPEAFLADKPYDADALIEAWKNVGSSPSFPPRPTGSYKGKPTSRSITNAILSNDSFATSNGSAQLQHATTDSPAHFLPPFSSPERCFGSTDDTP